MNFFLEKITNLKSIYKLSKLQKCGRGSKISRDVYIFNPEYIVFGENVYIGPDSRIEAWDLYEGESFTPEIILGNNVKVNSKCHIGAINSVFIDNDCLLGSNVMIIDHSHGMIIAEEANIHPVKRKLYSKGRVSIGKRCWIGENAVILPNVKIGDSVIVGASSVVTKDVPSMCVVGGNPAKILRYL